MTEPLGLVRSLGVVACLGITICGIFDLYSTPASAAGVELPSVPAYTGAELQSKFGLIRFVDKEANVLCYMVAPDGPGAPRIPAMSCVPAGKTAIGREGKIYQ